MGDRCAISISIHGPIETVEAFDEIVEAIVSQGLHSESYGGDENGIFSEFFHSIGEKYPPQFYDHDCNYGDIGDLEAVLQEHGVGYSASHDAGDNYPAACFAFYPGDGRYEAVDDGDGASVSLADLRKAMKERRKLDAVRELITNAEKANGTGLPKFAVSAAVQAHMDDDGETNA